MAERPKLGQLLLGAEVIAEGQLAAALEEQKQTGRPLGMTLVDLGFLDEETLVRTLARQLSLPIAWIRGKKIRQHVLELVPARIVGAHRCLPVRVDDQGGEKTLLLAMEDPADVAVLDEVAVAAGMPVRPVLAAPSEILESIQRHFPDLALAPAAHESSARAELARELVPGLESEALASAGGDDKDDACMSSLPREAEEPARAPDASPPSGQVGAAWEALEAADPGESIRLDFGAVLPGDEPEAPATADTAALGITGDLDAEGLDFPDPDDSASLELEADLDADLDAAEPASGAGHEPATLPFESDSEARGVADAGAGDPDSLDLDAPGAPPLPDPSAFELSDGLGDEPPPQSGPETSTGLDSGPAIDLSGPFDAEAEEAPKPPPLAPEKLLEQVGLARDPAEAPEADAPELVCLSGVSPLSNAAAPASPPALSSVGPDVILRALSQLLVEKGVIGRDELIARLTKLSGRDPADPAKLADEIG